MAILKAAWRRDNIKESGVKRSQSSLFGTVKLCDSGRTGRHKDAVGDNASEAIFPCVMRASRRRRGDLDFGSC
jgi:hypothetical protein